MAFQRFSSSEVVQPIWMAEALMPDKLLPGGAKVAAAAFPIIPFYTINVASAGAALGATTLPVDALPIALLSGTLLDFGALPQATITAAATPADDATSLTVAALTRAIPANTYLSFGSGKFAVVTAAAAIGATSLTTLAMPAGTKPANTNTATVPAGRKIATLTADAAVGATSLTVAALGFQAVDADAAIYAIGTERRIESGTLLGRTYIERDAGTGFGPYAANDDEVYLLAFQIDDATIDNDATLVRHQTLIKENWLPGWASYSTEAKAALRAAYQVTRG